MRNLMLKSLVGLLVLGASAITSADTTYLTCYYNGDSKWEWGLSDEGKYQKITGQWYETRNTKIDQFHVTSSWPKERLVQVCKTTLEQKGIYSSLSGIYAANSNVGSNYAIIVNGQELKP